MYNCSISSLVSPYVSFIQNIKIIKPIEHSIANMKKNPDGVRVSHNYRVNNEIMSSPPQITPPAIAFAFSQAIDPT